MERKTFIDACGDRRWFKLEEFENDSSDEPQPVARDRAGLGEGNLVSSLTEDGTHRPALDLDIPARLVPSTTEGHSHLYLDVNLSQEEYQKLLDVMWEVGILQRGFVSQLERLGATFLRPPWVKKEATVG